MLRADTGNALSEGGNNLLPSDVSLLEVGEEAENKQINNLNIQNDR